MSAWEPCWNPAHTHRGANTGLVAHPASDPDNEGIYRPITLMRYTEAIDLGLAGDPDAADRALRDWSS